MESEPGLFRSTPWRAGKAYVPRGSSSAILSAFSDADARPGPASLLGAGSASARVPGRDINEKDATKELGVFPDRGLLSHSDAAGAVVGVTPSGWAVGRVLPYRPGRGSINARKTSADLLAVWAPSGAAEPLAAPQQGRRAVKQERLDALAAWPGTDSDCDSSADASALRHASSALASAQGRLQRYAADETRRRLLAGAERFFLPASDAGGEWAAGGVRAQTLRTEGLAAERKSSILGVGRPQLHSAGAADADTESSYGGRWVAAPVSPPTMKEATPPPRAWPQLSSRPSAADTPEEALPEPRTQHGAHPADSLGAGVAEAGPPHPWRRLRRATDAAGGPRTLAETSRLLSGGDLLPSALPVAFVAERRGGGAQAAAFAASATGRAELRERVRGGGGAAEVHARQAQQQRREIAEAERRAVRDLPLLQERRARGSKSPHPPQ